jgi:hypothetical protein
MPTQQYKAQCLTSSSLVIHDRNTRRVNQERIKERYISRKKLKMGFPRGI